MVDHPNSATINQNSNRLVSDEMNSQKQQTNRSQNTFGALKRLEHTFAAHKRPEHTAGTHIRSSEAAGTHLRSSEAPATHLWSLRCGRNTHSELRSACNTVAVSEAAGTHFRSSEAQQDTKPHRCYKINIRSQFFEALQPRTPHCRALRTFSKDGTCPSARCEKIHLVGGENTSL